MTAHAPDPALVTLRCGPRSLDLDQPPSADLAPVAAALNSRVLRIFPGGPVKHQAFSPTGAADPSPLALIMSQIAREGTQLPPGAAAEESLRRSRSRPMANAVIEPLYELVINAGGQVMLAIMAKDGEPVQPMIIISDREPEAVLRRGGGLVDVALTDLHPDAATILRQLGELIVVESGGQGVARTYAVTVKTTNRPLR